MTSDCCVFIQYLSEANDVETWIKEKTAFVSNADYGIDESASDKLLAKHKVLIIFCHSKILLHSSF